MTYEDPLGRRKAKSGLQRRSKMQSDSEMDAMNKPQIEITHEDLENMEDSFFDSEYDDDDDKSEL